MHYISLQKLQILYRFEFVLTAMRLECGVRSRNCGCLHFYLTIYPIICLDELLDFIIEYKDKSTTSASEDVGEGTLEEGTSTFILGNLGPAV